MKQETSEYHKEYYGKPRSKKRVFYSLLFLIIIALVAFLVFSENLLFTGRAIDSVDWNNSINFEAELSIPNINLKGEYEEILISTRKGDFIYLDDKKINLDNIENKIIINGFTGSLQVDNEFINKIQGKILGITINNVPINMRNGGKLDFSLSPGSKYNSLEIKDDVYIKKISFITSGKINFEDNPLSINSERVTFEDYIGELKIESGLVNFRGIIKNLKVFGDSREIVFSKN